MGFWSSWDLSLWEQLGTAQVGLYTCNMGPEQEGVMAHCGTLPGGRALLCQKPGAQCPVEPLSQALVLGKVTAQSHL